MTTYQHGAILTKKKMQVFNKLQLLLDQSGIQGDVTVTSADHYYLTTNLCKFYDMKSYLVQ